MLDHSSLSYHTLIAAFLQFRGLRAGDVPDNPVHILKEPHQRGTLLGREVRLILLNVPPNVRKLVLALGNAMRKNVE